MENKCIILSISVSRFPLFYHPVPSASLSLPLAALPVIAEHSHQHITASLFFLWDCGAEIMLEEERRRHQTHRVAPLPHYPTTTTRHFSNFLTACMSNKRLRLMWGDKILCFWVLNQQGELKCWQLFPMWLSPLITPPLGLALWRRHHHWCSLACHLS